MKYFCGDCGREMPNLEAPSPGENHDLICPQCAEKVWKQVRIELLAQELQRHFQRIP